MNGGGTWRRLEVHPLDFTHQARLCIPCLLVATYTRRQTDYRRGGVGRWEVPVSVPSSH